MPLLRWNQVSRSLTCMLFALSLVSCSVETTITPTEDAGQDDAPVTEIQRVQAPLSKSSISPVSAAPRAARKNEPNRADMPTTQPT